MKIRIPNFIGRKLYFKLRRWEISKHFKTRPIIRIESYFCNSTMKTKNYGVIPTIDVNYYIKIGGKKI